MSITIEEFQQLNIIFILMRKSFDDSLNFYKPMYQIDLLKSNPVDSQPLHIRGNLRREGSTHIHPLNIYKTFTIYIFLSLNIANKNIITIRLA